MMKSMAIGRFCRAAVLGICVLLSGCRSTGARSGSGPILEPLSKEAAVRIVNDNIAQVQGTFRATGSVDGHFVASGSKRRVSYHVDGTLFYLPPHFVRFDMKKLGDRQALFGSNDQFYWAYTKDDDQYVCGRMDGSDGTHMDVPLPPGQIVEALGLIPIPGNGAGAKHQVHSEFQTVTVGNKEYWLDRRAPRLVRKVIFRDTDGGVAMVSDLGDYRPVEGSGQLPHFVDAQWPARNARLRFDVGRWTAVTEVTPGGPQFATPRECLEQSSYSYRGN